MQLGAFSGAIFAFCTWFYRLAFINILWILFTVLGLGILGFFPATIALLSTLRQYINQQEVAIFSTFWSYYKQEFIKSNKIGAFIIIIALILFSHIQFFRTTDIAVSELLYISSIIVSCFYFLVICYFLYSYVEFEIHVKTHIKNSLLIAIYSPLASLYIIFGFCAVYFANAFIPSLSIFFSVSILGLVILSSAKLAYRKIEKNQSIPQA
ncbi:YesL family protein [Halalkalibacter sp. APA_J-10(15)]|uniref:YesL family protein n=1 Tax=Halalkalibacter sp. APA_J-10(15) TaxID=2933805 RepID=UPI001FF5783C|nr:DUF624 domain-containing protein [Halalkalibacter sp. APA_J-10(15)]MCK0473209.1 DUF624 domain-containing protein [Halalkalibacter sp. APA_J-10(15)]